MAQKWRMVVPPKESTPDRGQVSSTDGWQIMACHPLWMSEGPKCLYASLRTGNFETLRQVSS